MSAAKLCWLDVRHVEAGLRTAMIEEAVHQRVHGVVAADPSHLDGLPPTVRRILVPDPRQPWEEIGCADLVLLPVADCEARAKTAELHPGVEIGGVVEVDGPETLEQACSAARTEVWTLLHFHDPTKIPLEIVLAAAAAATGTVVVCATDVEDAVVTLGVLEVGPGGVLLHGRDVGDATRLLEATRSSRGSLGLVELSVTRTWHMGMGERACVDTCSYLGEDEGMLVGSHARGLMLCVSETHPLPYMPTRPFRVNAGAIHSYVMTDGGRTRYLSELRTGSPVLVADVHGRSRIVTVGRVKIESRPLIGVDATAPDGQVVNLVLQDDWHVRVLGPGGAVLNSTELAPGDRVLGHLPTSDRHVGYPIDEFCREQ